MHERDRSSFADLFASALHLQQCGRVDDAIHAYERALCEDGHAVAALYNYGCMLMAAGRRTDALEVLCRADRLAPNDADTLHALGFICTQLGRHEAAIAYLSQSLACTANITVYVRLAQVLLAAGRFAEARTAFDTILAGAPERSDCHEGIGIILYQAGRLDEAIVALEHAATCDETNATAACNLARALLEAGDTKAARHWIERAIARNPNDARFYLFLVNCTAGPLAPAIVAAMTRLVRAGAALPLEQRVELHFSLGKACERAGRIAEAFRHLAHGNALKRAQLPYNEFAAIGYLGRLRATFTPAFMEPLRGAGDASERPVFVFGMPRSGTTLVEQILAAHPDVGGTGEIGVLHPIVSALWPGPSAGVPALRAAVAEIGRRYLDATDTLAQQSARLIDKTLDNFQLAPLITLALPNARMIHVQRNWLDTSFSAFATLFEENDVPFSYDLGELGRYHRAYLRVMKAWTACIPANRLLTVRYEALVNDFATEARRILAFCNLPWDDACASFHTVRRRVRTASSFQVRQPLTPSAIGRAQPFLDDLRPLIAAVCDR